MPYATESGEASNPSDVIVIWRRLWKRRWWIAGSSVSAAILAASIAFLMAPVYRATIVLIPASDSRAGLGSMLGSSLGALGGIAELAGFSPGDFDSAKQEALAVLRSRQFTNAFIMDRNLIPVLFKRKWDERHGKWKVPEGKQPSLADAFKYFDTHVRTIIEDQRSGMVMLQIHWQDREEAAVWANELVARLNSEMQRRAILEADASLGYLTKELNESSLVETRDNISRLIESQLNKRMLANVSVEYAFRIVDPATPADRDDVVRPRKLIMVLIGAFLGLLVGVIAVTILRR